MTETLIVFVTAFAGFLFTDPIYGGALTKASIAKMPLLAMAYGGLTFHLVGRALVAPQRLRAAAAEVLAAWWPIIVLGLWISFGSALARWGQDVKENFLGMGLGMLFLPAMALAVRSSAHPWAFMKALGAMYVLTVIGMLSVLLLGAHVFHEEIFLAVPLGAYFLSARPLRIWQAVLGLAMIASCLYSVKNTTFLLVLTTLAAWLLVGLLRLPRSKNRLAVVTGLYFGIPALGAALYAGFRLYSQYRKSLPTGNVEYRTEMYTIAWEHFLDSPIWGDMFTGSSVHYFDLYRVALATQNLPTHSDVLDILSHGGAIAITLWALTVWRILSIAWDAARKVAAGDTGPQRRAWRCLFVLALIQIGALVTYAVNPPLISPVHGFWTWGSAALLWALHRGLVTAPDAPARAPQPVRRSAWA